MANQGTIKDDMLERTLDLGLRNLQVFIVALDSSNAVLANSGEIEFPATSINRTMALPEVVLSITGGNTVSKIVLRRSKLVNLPGGGSETQTFDFWELSTNYVFEQDGTLTLNLGFKLGPTGVLGSSLTQMGIARVLERGLSFRDVRVFFLDTVEGTEHVTGIGSFDSPVGGSGEFTVDITSSFSTDVPSGAHIESADITVDFGSGVGYVKIVDNLELDYEFNESGTLTVSELEFKITA